MMTSPPLFALAEPTFGLEPQHVEALRQHWTWLCTAIGPRLPHPQVEPGDEGSVRLVWSRAAYYAELELHGDGTHEWFVRDRRIDSHDGSAGPERGAPSRRFYERLRSALGMPPA